MILGSLLFVSPSVVLEADVCEMPFGAGDERAPVSNTAPYTNIAKTMIAYTIA